MYMECDYIFTEKEKYKLYEELEKIVNSNSYKMLIKEYDKFVSQIVINTKKNSLDNPLAVSYLLKKNFDDKYIDVLFKNYQTDVDLDMLYKTWGSRVCTGVYSSRHIISLINDVLIRNGYLSCKVLAKKDKFKMPFTYNFNKDFMLNYILLCLIINNKKVYLDVENNKILEYNSLLSNLNYKCYQPIIGKDDFKFFVCDTHEYNLEINGDHLFTLNHFLLANEYCKDDYCKKNIFQIISII